MKIKLLKASSKEKNLKVAKKNNIRVLIRKLEESGHGGAHL
jgi:hypothetical protein